MRTVGKIAFVLIFVLTLFACATRDDYDTALNDMLGASDAEIQAKFGRPSAMKILENGDIILSYTKIDDIFVPSEFYTYNQGNEINGMDATYSPFLNTYLFSDEPGNIGYDAKYICKTIFLLQNNKVTSWKWQGNNCVAP